MLRLEVIPKIVLGMCVFLNVMPPIPCDVQENSGKKIRRPNTGAKNWNGGFWTRLLYHNPLRAAEFTLR